MVKIRTRVSFTLICACALFIVVGCAGTQDEKLEVQDIRSALRHLPFPHELKTVTPPARDDAAFLGVAHDENGAVLHFSIGLGDVPDTVPIPGVTRPNPVGNTALGFVFNDDVVEGQRFSSAAQWHAAMHIATEIEERLCVEVTGQPCPV